MSDSTLLIIATIVVSWVMFVFNFVLGYYIGRAVEAGEKKKEKETEKKKPTRNQHGSLASNAT